ncbi:MAG: DegQ family serine endoprotease [Chlamydiales bacterium]
MKFSVKKGTKLFLGALFLFTTPHPLAAQDDLPQANETLLRQISQGFAKVAKKAIPAVVYIESQGVEEKKSSSSQSRRQPYDYPFDFFNDDFFNRFFGLPRQEQNRPPELVRGSGFIISEDGYILTNNHVVEEASKVKVTLQNGHKVLAKVIGTDPKTDLAVIKIDDTNLPYLSLGDSDTLQVGDWAVAVGNPFGLQATVTVGVVSAKGRNQLRIADFEDFIQTDAAINPGHSGGPLLNVNGEVIGINTAIVSGSGGYMGIGFAIPSNMARRITDQLIDKGSVTRGFLGVSLQPIDSDLQKFYHLDSPHGALVAEVIEGSPADKAGLKQEDIILSYNGTKVESLGAFRNYVSLMEPGSPLTLQIKRDGKIMNLEVKVSSAPEEKMGPNSPVQRLGMKVQELTPELAQKIGYPSETKGIVISEIALNGPAAEAALQPGSLILAVNRHKVTTMEEFSKAINEATQGDRVLLRVRQGDAVRFVALQFED